MAFGTFHTNCGRMNGILVAFHTNCRDVSLQLMRRFVQVAEYGISKVA